MPGGVFDKCLDNEPLQKKVLAVREDGSKKGVDRTPSFFVNGMLMRGGLTVENFAEAMKPYLK